MLQGVVFQDIHGQIVAMNPAAERILGRGLDELGGQTSADLEHATLREDGTPFPGAEHPAMVALRSGQVVPRAVMGVFNPREQAYRWLAISAVPLFQPDAQTPYQVYTLFEDITAHRRRDAQLHQSEALAATAFRANPAAMSITRLSDGRFIDINASHERLFGYPRDTLIGRTADEVAIYADPRQRGEMVRIMREQGSLRDTELTLRTRTGELREVLCSLETLELYGERCILGCVVDITARKQVEQTLRASEERFRQVFLATPTPKLITRVDNRQIIDANPAFAAMSGYTLSQLRGQTTDALGLWPEGLQAAARAQLYQDGRLTDHEIPLRTRDGSLRELLLSVVTVELDGAACFLTVMLDQTERKRALAERTIAEQALQAERALLTRRVAERTADLSLANAELARAARLKDEFLANMSHELRTPLNSILGRSEALQEAIYGPVTPEQLSSLQGIEESGQHLLSLINDILDLSKIEAGRLELEAEPLEVDLLCPVCLRMVAQTALLKRISLSSAYDSQVQTLIGDERRLKQLLVNLLSNAVKFTPEGGKVGLEVRGNVEEQTVTFTVWDTGIGIAAEDLPKLFQPFVQIDSSLSRHYSGTGLGLALVLRLTEAHGGSLSVESTPGQGSRFQVRLPWEPAASAAELMAAASGDTAAPALGTTSAVAPPTDPAPPPAAAAQRPHILLADDNQANIDILCDYLQAKGYDITVAHNGAEALVRAQEKLPGVILMDMQMPGMDGLEAMRRIRADPALREVPIIAVTALAMPGDRERCTAAGADDYLTKPLHLRHLIAQIEALRRKRG